MSQAAQCEWLRRILGVDFFADVVSVDASGMTDAACSQLSDLRSLQWLDLAGTPISDSVWCISPD